MCSPDRSSQAESAAGKERFPRGGLALAATSGSACAELRSTGFLPTLPSPRSHSREAPQGRELPRCQRSPSMPGWLAVCEAPFSPLAGDSLSKAPFCPLSTVKAARNTRPWSWSPHTPALGGGQGQGKPARGRGVFLGAGPRAGGAANPALRAGTKPARRLQPSRPR